MIKLFKLNFLFSVIILNLSLLLSVNTYSFGQDNNFSLKEYEDTLKTLFNDAFLKDSIKYIRNDSEKLELNNKILTLFQEALEYDSSFNYPFSSLKNIGIITTNDKLVKIYTWNLKFTKFKFKYYGFVQYYNKKKNKYIIYNLTDNTNNIVDPEQSVLSNTNWYGSLYYDIIETDVKGETVYTLLGWKGNSLNTNKKVVETLYISNAGKLVFGKPIISINDKLKKRMIFEFSIKTNMVLKYNDLINMIIFDYLVPPNTSLMGQYQYYGADGSYDGLKFENDVWKFQSKVIVGTPKTVRDDN